nr:PREDICTED: lysophosphatidic acid receptor 3-like [Latimeria chalumnae]|eukprot:XP_005986947.1 PREDICTED: lysophosphatidic acid receptor 3-like [Latimeria chalumnae]
MMETKENCSYQRVNHTMFWSSTIVLALGIPQVITNLISVICNSAVIIAFIASSKALHKPIFILFCNLAVSDLLASSSALWIALLFIEKPDSTIYGSKELLHAYVFFATSILSTIYNLVSIGIERFLAVAPCTMMKYKISQCQTLTAALISWGIAIIFGSLPLLGWNCLHKSELASTLYSPFCIDYLVFITIPNCVVAFVLLLCTYIAIIVILKRQKAIIQASGHTLTVYKMAELHVARTSIFIWILTVISYAPFFAGVLWDAIHVNCPLDLHIGVYVFRNVTATLITLNCLGNPIIYSLKFKNLENTLNFCKCAHSNRIHIRTIGNI